MIDPIRVTQIFNVFIDPKDLKDPFNSQDLIANLEKLNISEEEWKELRDSNGNNILHYIVQYKTAEIVAWCLAKYPALMDLNCPNASGILPIHLAAEWGNLPLFKTFASRCDLTVPGGNKGWHAIHFACRNGHIELVSFLLEQHIPIEQKAINTEYTPLQVAVACGQLEMTKFLLANGAAIHQHDKFGNSLLHVACVNDKIKLVEFFLEKGFSVNQRSTIGNSALFYACINGCAEVVKYLLGKGARVDNPNHEGELPLHVAIRRGHKKCVEILLNTDAIFHPLDFGRHFNHYFITAIAFYQEEIVAFLLENEANIKARHEEKKLSYTPFIQQEIRYSYKAIHVLGITLAEKFEPHKAESMLQLLLKHGVDIHALSDKQETALHVVAEMFSYAVDKASYENCIKAIDFLLSKTKIDSNAKNFNGVTFCERFFEKFIHSLDTDGFMKEFIIILINKKVALANISESLLHRSVVREIIVEHYPEIFIKFYSEKYPINSKWQSFQWLTYLRLGLGIGRKFSYEQAASMMNYTREAPQEFFLVLGAKFPKTFPNTVLVTDYGMFQEKCQPITARNILHFLGICSLLLIHQPKIIKKRIFAISSFFCSLVDDLLKRHSTDGNYLNIQEKTLFLKILLETVQVENLTDQLQNFLAEYNNSIDLLVLLNMATCKSHYLMDDAYQKYLIQAIITKLLHSTTNNTPEIFLPENANKKMKLEASSVDAGDKDKDKDKDKDEDKDKDKDNLKKILIELKSLMTDSLAIASVKALKTIYRHVYSYCYGMPSLQQLSLAAITADVVEVSCDETTLNFWETLKDQETKNISRKPFLWLLPNNVAFFSCPKFEDIKPPENGETKKLTAPEDSQQMVVDDITDAEVLNSF